MLFFSINPPLFLEQCIGVINRTKGCAMILKNFFSIVRFFERLKKLYLFVNFIILYKSYANLEKRNDLQLNYISYIINRINKQRKKRKRSNNNYLNSEKGREGSCYLNLNFVRRQRTISDPYLNSIHQHFLCERRHVT